MSAPHCPHCQHQYPSWPLFSPTRCPNCKTPLAIEKRRRLGNKVAQALSLIVFLVLWWYGTNHGWFNHSTLWFSLSLLAVIAVMATLRPGEERIGLMRISESEFTERKLYMKRLLRSVLIGIAGFALVYIALNFK